MQSPLRLVLNPSRYLTALLLLSHTAALVGLFPLDLPAWLKLVTGVVLLASAATSLRRYALLTAPLSVCELILREDGAADGRTRGRGIVAGVASPRSTVLPWLVVLLLEPASSRRPLPVVVLADSVKPREWRELRSWLRWNAIRPPAI